ncbi:MAG: hypothetical protein H8E34_14300 [Bacteroidetes bacterium]|nr:hypothetical protein [Bacteroidota bacterium]
MKSTATGSCFVIAAYDAKEMVGTLSHIMLPGVSGEKTSLPKTNYARKISIQLLRFSQNKIMKLKQNQWVVIKELMLVG